MPKKYPSVNYISREQDIDFGQYDYLIVGSGLFGLTVAEQLARSQNKKILILEKRAHIGGNAYAEIDAETGIEVHKYGSHLFHTSNEEVWNYVNKFTTFSPYVHRVRTIHNGQVFSMPINLHTINQFLKTDMTPNQAKIWVEECSKEIVGNPSNFEEKAISLIGRPLYEAFIKGYTEKQWQTDPKKLPESVISRLPVRYSYDDRYFNDTYEGLPSKGYFQWFENMIRSANIHVALQQDFFQYKKTIPAHVKIIYTGPIDRYFDYSEGILGWRTLDFVEEKLDLEDFQGISVMNYADKNEKFTRIHEFKHFHPDWEYRTAKTIIMREFSRFATEDDSPYYPINSAEDRKILEKYRIKIENEENVFFGGRLGRYQYLDMHMAIASALKLAIEIG